MRKYKIFLATPVSGFQNESQYASYRKSVLSLIDALSERYTIHAEIQEITGTELYNTPEESLRMDFAAINEADVFILLHPMRMQTSSLIELGYACALKKKMLIVGETGNLPYLVFGLTAPEYNASIIHTSTVNEETIAKIMNLLAILDADEDAIE